MPLPVWDSDAFYGLEIAQETISSLECHNKGLTVVPEELDVSVS